MIQKYVHITYLISVRDLPFEDLVSFHNTHTTPGHKCGQCNKYGHGRIECNNKELIDKAKIVEKSSPPMGGSINLKGLKIGSESWSIKLIAGCLLKGATQLIMMPTNMAQNSILRLINNIE